jgi:hypothetical protein
MKNEIENLRFRQILISCDQVGRNCFLNNPFFIQPLSVILNLDDEIAALVIGTQIDGSISGFSFLFPSSGLSIVIDAFRIMCHQGLIQLIDDVSVDLGILSVHLQSDLFAGIFGQIRTAKHL